MATDAQIQVYDVFLKQLLAYPTCYKAKICYNRTEPYLDVQLPGLDAERRMVKAMPTSYEERLAAVEQNLIQFKTETVRTYQDMAMHTTMLKGLAETTIGRLATMQWQIDQRFNTIETALQEHTTTLQEH